ncbi:MAG: metallophosphoesterase [Oscillospiraceae bacterium]|nr:metallophosphoesterase [Oscillospiraceae bacterium]
MALYTIGDLHLSLAKEKPMDIFGSNWTNHTEKLRQGFASLTDEDVTVLCGDLSWAMGLEESKPDFQFIDSLPGKKIILKGNHDFWWSTAAKTKRFFDANGITTLDILNNNCFFFGDLALCGTRGWFYEEEKNGEHDKKIMRREIMRLEASLKAAGDREKLVFLHYPPVYMDYRCEEILALLKEHRVPLCCYGHIHGRGCKNAFNGIRDGTQFKLVSADFVDFKPVKLLDDPDI